MPTVTNEGAELYYETSGTGPTVMFVPDIGFGAWQWAWQYPALAGPYRTVVWNMRGTGNSTTTEGPYTIGTLTDDLGAVHSAIEHPPVHLIGAGLGGMIALAYAHRRSHVRSLVLLGSSATGDDSVIDRNALDAAFGSPESSAALRESCSMVLSPQFRQDQPDVIDWIVERRAVEDASEAGWQAQRAALESFDYRDVLYEISVPSLVIHGRDDPIFEAAAGEALAEGLPRGRYVDFPGAYHFVWVERSRPVNDEILGFLDEHADGDDE